MITRDMIDDILSMGESMSEEERKVIEDAAEIILRHQCNGGRYGPFESKVTAIGNTYYTAIGEAVRMLDLKPRDRVKVTVEKC